MSKKTPLYDQHIKQNAHIVDFAGWLMPLNYGSQIQEHNAVRNHCGIFDVSHMGVVDIQGADTLNFLRYLLANDATKLKDNGALYSCMLTENGGVIDDLIIYRFSPDHFRLVINAGCREKDFQWMQKNATKFDVKFTFQKEMCLLALQGPDAIALLEKIFDKNINEKVSQLKPFQFYAISLADTGYRIPDTVFCRTGYTGESGVEIMLSEKDANTVFEKCMQLQIQPCGLGARDTLRLEAAYNLYGNDMTENTSPLISNLSWTVSFKDESRDFIGKKALLSEKESGITQQLVGLVLESKGVLRAHQIVKTKNGLGEITSGTFSPTLNKSIALARIPLTDEDEVLVERRNEWLAVKIVKLPFYKK